MRGPLIRLAALVLAASHLHAAGASKPGFELVPAKLCQVRDGLGNVFAKLEAGKAVRVAYFGGSITAQQGWRPKTLKWLQGQYPQAQVTETNAAIGGTGSGLGVYRYGHDVLAHKPDLVFVEFAVNDGGARPEDIYRGMEGIVRQTWTADPTIDICYVYTFRVGYERDLDKGLCPRAASADEKLAAHYGIPSINVAMRIATLAREGKLAFKGSRPAKGQAGDAQTGKLVFSTDGVHPLDKGHDVYRDVIADALTQMRPASKPGPHALKEPFIADNWERAKLVPVAQSMLSAGWQKLDPAKGLARRFANRLPVIWHATRPGEAISFKCKGTSVGIYDIVGPDGCQLVFTVDGKPSPRPRARFDSYCSYHRLSHCMLASGLTDAVHSVRVEIHPDQPDRTPAIAKEKRRPNVDPAKLNLSKYNGTALRVGWIMLIGDIVE